MATLESLHELLNSAAKTLHEVARAIGDVPLEPAEPNVLRVANVLGEVFELQLQVYILRPELIPTHLWEAREGSSPSPDQVVEGAFRRAIAAESAGDTAMAIALLEFLLRTQPSGQHVARVRLELARMKKA